MQQNFCIEISSLEKQKAKEIQMGDWTSAYCTSKRILNILESSNPGCDELPGHLCELGVICTALDKFAEGARHLQRAIDFCNERRRTEDARLIERAKRLLDEIAPEHSISSLKIKHTKQAQSA